MVQIYFSEKLVKVQIYLRYTKLTGNEMDVLQEEFMHHQQKIDEYHQLKTLVEQIDGKRHFMSLIMGSSKL